MLRSASTFTLAVLLLFSSFAIFTSAAPTCGGSENVPDQSGNTPSPSGDDDSTTTTNTTVVNDSVNTSGGTYSGRATWFEVGQGACGEWNTDSDFIVALAAADYGDGSHCNQNLKITNPANGATQYATVRDKCPGCSSGDLDMSPALFQSLDGDLGNGVFQMYWGYV